MMKRFAFAAVCAVFVTTSAHTAENLVINGKFDDYEDPLKGWMTDYRWSKSTIYSKNHERISVVPNEGVYSKVCKLSGKKGYSEVRIESNPIKFEQEHQYTCTLDFKGGQTHLYFAGYKWKPGIRPHENPNDGELRLIYKSKLEKAKSTGWKKVTFQIPGVNASALSMKHMKYVRFIRVYAITIGGGKDTFIDNVVVTKKPYAISSSLR